MLETIIQAWKEMTSLEIIAVFSAILYVVLAAKRIIWCWPLALISTICYLILCFNLKLYLESGLQVFYLLMAIYGWINWKKNSRVDSLKLSTWQLSTHLKLIFLGILATILLGFLFTKFSDASLPYLDAFTTVFSLAATFMVVYRLVENWIYWIIIDAACIFLYGFKELYLSSLLFAAYVIIASIGYVKWRNAYKLQEA